MSNEENIIDNAQKAGKEIGEATSEAGKAVADDISDAAGKASDAASEVGEAVTDQIAEATDKVGEAVDKTSDAVDQASEAVADQIPEITDEATPAESEGSELDALVEKLKAATPASLADSQYSPLGLITLLQEYFPKLPADLQSRIMDLFQGMDAKDLVSVETWKGVVTMVLYSAKAQAEQVTSMVDSVLPDPLKSSSLLGMLQGAMDKYTPSVVKGAASSVKEMASGLGTMASSLEGMSAEDLVDPETWKGLYYMLDYGLRAQATLLKERITGGEEEDE